MSGPDHIDDDLLAQLAEHPESLDEATRSRIETHLHDCAQCSGAFAVTRHFAEALPDGETWWIADELTTGRGRTTLRAFAARIGEEDREADRLLAKLIGSPYRFTSSASAIVRRARTGGAVRLLCQAAQEACTREPLHALNLATVAQQIADALPDDYYPAEAVNELRGGAWKAIANANWFLGRFDEGFKACDRAEAAYRRLSNPMRQLARISFIRGWLHLKQQNYPKALASARDAAERSTGSGDLEGFALASNLEAGVLHRLGRTDEALDRLTAVQAAAQMLGNLSLEASAINNVGNFLADRGDYTNGLRHLGNALQIFTELNHTTEVLRVRWKIGQIALSTGNFASAERQLLAVNRESTELGMDSDVALIKLDLAETRLVLGDIAGAKTLCVEIFGFFREARMLTGALTAAAFLEELAHRGALTPKHIDHVRRFVRTLRENPDAVFLRPPD